MTEAILTDIVDGVGTLTLNRPAKLNAWDTPMRAAMSAVPKAWNDERAERAVILIGAGDRAFSAARRDGEVFDRTARRQLVSIVA